MCILQRANVDRLTVQPVPREDERDAASEPVVDRRQAVGWRPDVELVQACIAKGRLQTRTEDAQVLNLLTICSDRKYLALDFRKPWKCIHGYGARLCSCPCRSLPLRQEANDLAPCHRRRLRILELLDHGVTRVWQPALRGCFSGQILELPQVIQDLLNA